jgi:hypothetical protein
MRVAENLDWKGLMVYHQNIRGTNSCGTEFIMTFDKQNLRIAISSLSFNLDKTNYVHFTAKSNTNIDININFEDIQINIIYNIKFLELTTDNTQPWKKQIEKLASKLSCVGYSIRSLKSIMYQKKFKNNFIFYLHSVMLCRIIFWGKLPHSKSIFKYKKE